MQSRVELVTLSSTYRVSEPSAHRRNIDPILLWTLSSSLGAPSVAIQSDESLSGDLKLCLVREDLATGGSPYICSVDLFTHFAQCSKVTYLLQSYGIVVAH